MKVLQDISGKKVAKYIVLPGIIPRLQDLATRGFGELAFLMALIYGSVRLLPADHPYLLPVNKGRFGIRNVIAVAASRLVFKRENTDQILIFFALLASFVLLVLQFAYLIISFVLHPAMAGPPLGMFDTPQAQRSTDVAFMLLDSVFGIPGFFQSCVDTSTSSYSAWLQTSCGGGVFPTPFHEGLHELFRFYSMAMLLIGVIIFVYYVFIVVGETAQTGTPFGKRFDHIWAPIRLVVALGLLVPVSYGLNSAQYIVLYAAKLGSGFATNAWTLYNKDMESPLGLASTAPQQNSVNPYPPSSNSTNALVARPQPPEIYPLMQFMSLVQACRAGYETLHQDAGYSPSNERPAGMKIRPYLVEGQNREWVENLYWGDALKFYNNHDIIIRFGDDGDYNGDDTTDNKMTTPNTVYPGETGGVAPLCGEITVHTSDLTGLDNSGAIFANNTGTAIAQAGYFSLVMEMWKDPNLINFGVRAACLHIKPQPSAGGAVNGNCTKPAMGNDDNLGRLPSDGWKQDQAKYFASEIIQNIIDPTYKSVLATTDFKVTQDILNRGWGGAGIWYTKLAQWNGAVYDATRIIPTPSSMPKIMEKLDSQKNAHDNTSDVCKKYEAHQSNNQAPATSETSDLDMANMLNDVYQYWQCGTQSSKAGQADQGNIAVNAINWIFGSSGIFDLRRNDTVHPLAQLVALGKGIMDATMRNLLTSMGFAAGGGFLQAINWSVMSGLASMGSAIFSSIAIIGVTIGFTLYYVLPVMPFIYFFFAVGAWVKAIFEAMVGVPLWALAHLKIEGQGLPAGSAMTGYFMIFEIFLRPILTVLGLLASIAILSALIHSLNSIFGLVTSNVSGFDCAGNCILDLGAGVSSLDAKRDAYDQFFFTIMYTIIVYLMAVSSFKMIDQIPGSVMRWMGYNAQAFEDGVGDPVATLGGKVSVGTQLVSNQVIPGLTGASGTLGGAGGSLAKSMQRKK